MYMSIYIYSSLLALPNPAIHIDTCVHIHTYTHTHARTHAHIYPSLLAHPTLQYTLTHVYTHTYHTHTTHIPYTHTHVHTDTHTHARTRMRANTHTHTHTHTCPVEPLPLGSRGPRRGSREREKEHATRWRSRHTPLDHWTPIAGGDDSNATAEAIAACAGIAPFNSLQG